MALKYFAFLEPLGRGLNGNICLMTKFADDGPVRFDRMSSQLLEVKGPKSRKIACFRLEI